VSRRDHIPENLRWPAISDCASRSALLNAQSGHPESAGALHDGRCPDAEIDPQSQCKLYHAPLPFNVLPKPKSAHGPLVATAGVSKGFSPVRPLLSEDVANRPQILVI
jgi:hypothetical protein